ncbi:hypothetical protein L3V43_05020 [Pseudoalteromonas sp. L23]|uniref:hypothetical protein n=1 Tax=unclassified Pseudoalteromonas TaxID=194690 RepID=UPI001EF1250F|nr:MULTISPECIES: hypothetical protein [unclassified Pseudoalteromonas]MCF7512965.1 hypothetical protein [Pseudoalteromonas sp. L7]MCF7525005.1 hypothetical protein [Pseudoalteromonas sp. L23]
MANPGFIKNFHAAGTLGAYRIAAYFDQKDFTVAQSADPSKPIVGLTEHGSDRNGRVDIVMTQTGNVEYGGDIKNGDPIVPDENGKAIALDISAYAEDAQIWVLGNALEDGRAGTIGTSTINPFLIVK